MDVQKRIEAILSGQPIVLFMKGNRTSPQCGFSARVVDILDELTDDYATVDVLADEALREGIKTFGQWPTIPQLYVGGRLIGGADIVTEMSKSGELAPLLGVAGPRPPEVPEINVSEAAVVAFRGYAGGAAKPGVRLAIDRAWAVELDIEDPRAGDLVIDLGTLTVSMDPATARRAGGITIDHVDAKGGAGFRIENPSAPPRVRAMEVEDLAKLRESGKPHLLLDVRTPEERAIARIEGSSLLDGEMRARLEELDRSTTMIFHCHHGIRSRAAAEHCVRMGFRDVWNVEGGIEAWSQRIDTAVPRY